MGVRDVSVKSLAEFNAKGPWLHACYSAMYVFRINATCCHPSIGTPAFANSAPLGGLGAREDAKRAVGWKDVRRTEGVSRALRGL